MIWLFVRSVSDKVFHDKEYQTLLNVENMTDINALVSMVYKLFDKTSVSAGISTHLGTGIYSENQQLAVKLH